MRSSVFVTLLALVVGTLIFVNSAPAQPPVFGKASPSSVSGFGPEKGGPKIGDEAPNFELKFLDSKETFKLSENFDKRPTLLIFHSFT